MLRILFLSPRQAGTATTSSRRRRLFSPHRGRVRLPLHRSRRALREKGRSGRAEAHGASFATNPRWLVHCVVGLWHAIGRPADRGSASRDQRFVSLSRQRKPSRPPKSSHTRSVSLGIVG